MSAAAARRRKQLAKKKEAATAASASGADDPVAARLSALLSEQDEAERSEATAYEALQLAQSHVRRQVQAGNFAAAADKAYEVGLTLLSDRWGRVSVASQLLAELLRVLTETHTGCTAEWAKRFRLLDEAHRSALARSGPSMDPDELDRLGRLHLQFLRGAVKWSDSLGTVRYGDRELHELLGRECWRVAAGWQERAGGSKRDPVHQKDGDDEGADDASVPWLRCEAVTHLALAERPGAIADYLRDLPSPLPAHLKFGHTGPPAERDSLLTRSVLVLAAVENLRDANVLLRAYLDGIEERDTDVLKKSYMDKKDGVAPSHAIFCAMLLRVCEKETKTAPLYKWLLKNFQSELLKLYKPDVVDAYCSKIGRVYFGIEPPPDMMATLEGMMKGGLGGSPAGGGQNPMMNPAAMMQNPAMMQQMMQQMQQMGMG